MHDLEGITHGVVLPLERPETRQDLVVDAFYEHYFLEGVVVLDLAVLRRGIPSLDAVFRPSWRASR